MSSNTTSNITIEAEGVLCLARPLAKLMTGLSDCCNPQQVFLVGLVRSYVCLPLGSVGTWVECAGQVVVPPETSPTLGSVRRRC